MPERLTHKKQYLVWVDILGFGPLAEKIAKEKGDSPSRVRERFEDTLEDRIRDIEEHGLVIGKDKGRDDWIFVTDSFNEAFLLISGILDHDTGYTDYPKIPLEIAIGTGDYDRWVRFNEGNLIRETATIDFLKTYVVNHYRDLYKKENNQSIKSTFIVLTESAHEDLKPLDKKICEGKLHVDGHGKSIRFFVADVDKFLLRGKGLKFSKEIGYPNDEDYSRIYDLYVPPIGYEDIQKTLEEKRIVFITGTPEYGKTYTATRLMWDYCIQGYEPIWYKGGEEGQRTAVRERMQQIESELRPGRIIYFEDPFGKTRYERREGLEREIGVIVEMVGRARDTFVIITSREEVFKQFEREKLSATNLKEFEQRLNLKRPSYDYKKRKEILLRRAEKEGCVWLRDESLKESILKEIERGKLPTTMNVRDFAIASTNVKEEDKLMQIIQAKSIETAKVFAREIMEMSEDKQLFLTFSFIGNIQLDNARGAYEELVGRCKINHPWSFEDVLKWFEGDSIRISKGSQTDGDFIQFSHPSYYEALKYLLEGNDRFQKIVSLSLLNLSERDETALAVAETVARDFERLPEKVQNLLFKLSERDGTSGAVAGAVARNFERLPDGVRNQLLLKLSERDGIAWAVAGAVAENFERLPEEVQNLLFKLSERDETARAVVRPVVMNYKRLPEEAQDLLFKLSERDEETAWDVACDVGSHFERLPEEVRNQLLLKLSERDMAVWGVAWAVEGNFERIPEGLRNQLLLKLSERDECSWSVASTVARNYGRLPEEIQNLLFKLSERDKTAGDVAKAVARNFERLPEEVQDLLFKLSEKDRVASDVAMAVLEHFEKLPEDVRTLFFKCAKKDSAALSVALAVAELFEKLPKEIQNLLFELSESEKDSTAGAVAWAVMVYFERLPEGVRNLLFKVLKRKEVVRYVQERYLVRCATKDELLSKLPESVRQMF